MSRPMLAAAASIAPEMMHVRAYVSRHLLLAMRLWQLVFDSWQTAAA